MSSSDIAVSVRGLSKSYTIAHDQEKHSTLAETLLDRLKNPLKRRKTETFWALKDVSFDIKKGDVVGIIGRNGAGKSTLLKTLSRITEPTTGEIDLYGRVGSLLEVGTGFSGELTGRENIYLNGAILGMQRFEITRRFDEIVDFSGASKFLDTPVKRYSSGMYVRLAFAVAAHLQTEILIVDEVLAVGDGEFQKRCMDKMRDVASGGRTVLFVSHNMAAIQSLCISGVMLRDGRILQQGSTESVVSAYLSEGVVTGAGVIDLTEHPARSRHGTKWIQRIILLNEDGEPTTRFSSSRGVSIIIEILPPREIINPRIAVAIEDHHGRRIGTSASYFTTAYSGRFDQPFTAKMDLIKLGLGPGRYLLSVSIAEAGSGLLDSIDGAAWFDVEWDNAYATGESHSSAYGPVVIGGNWEVYSTSSAERRTLG